MAALSCGGHHDAVKVLVGQRLAQGVPAGATALNPGVDGHVEGGRALLDGFLQRQGDAGLPGQWGVQGEVQGHAGQKHRDQGCLLSAG